LRTGLSLGKTLIDTAESFRRSRPILATAMPRSMPSVMPTIFASGYGTVGWSMTRRYRARSMGSSQAARHGARSRAVARKLAVILHRVWRDQTEFRFGKEPRATASAAA
jgi:hypothetical protein